MTQDYITSVDDLSETNITENMNYDKWRRAFNGKQFAYKLILLKDSMGNKKRYMIRFKYKETPKAKSTEEGEEKKDPDMPDANDISLGACKFSSLNQVFQHKVYALCHRAENSKLACLVGMPK